MPWRHTPAWISFGGAWLALHAGFINAVGFLGLHQAGLTHVTGQLTRASIQVGEQDLGHAWQAATLVTWFFLGALVSGVLIRRTELLERGRPYGVALLVETGLLVGAALLMAHEVSWGGWLAAMAAGLQNALATSYSGAVVRTTHMTGVVTDLGLELGHALRGERVERGKVKLLSLLLCSFVAGGALGPLGLAFLGRWVLLAPAAGLGLAAGWFFLLLRRSAGARG